LCGAALGGHVAIASLWTTGLSRIFSRTDYNAPMRLPQFTIRDLLWLMVVVAMGFALFLSQIKIGELRSYNIDLETINREYKTAVEREGYDLYEGPNGPFLVKLPADKNSN
jgi:hypothetical protein